MYRIVHTVWLAPDIKQLDVAAPRVARKWLAGQFVIVRVHDHGERIPLTVVEADPDGGTIRLVVLGVGKTTRLINALTPGDGLLDVVGPLGCATEVRMFGHAVIVSGGVGAAIGLPVARAFQTAGNFVTAILGARNRSRIILESEFRQASNRLRMVTDDGSYGQAGLVTQPLADLLKESRPVDRVVAIGPAAMMRGVAETTRARKIPTVVSLNTLMVDGTGMCGGCRVLVGGETRFACVDGPDFDAHQVDFALLEQRNRTYQDAERVALERFDKSPSADLQRVRAVCRLAQTHEEVAQWWRSELGVSDEAVDA